MSKENDGMFTVAKFVLSDRQKKMSKKEGQLLDDVRLIECNEFDFFSLLHAYSLSLLRRITNTYCFHSRRRRRCSGCADSRFTSDMLITAEQLKWFRYDIDSKKKDQIETFFRRTHDDKFIILIQETFHEKFLYCTQNRQKTSRKKNYN
jgi:hypothetical protein